MFKNNIFTHKILLIIGLVFFILFTFSISCFASDSTYEDLVFSYNGVTYNISNPANFSSDYAQKFGIVLLDNGELRFYYSEHSGTIFTGWYNDDGSINIDANCQFYYGQIVNNEWQYIGFVRSGDYGTFSGTLIYTNQDIVYDKEGNVFFQVPPQGTQVQLMKPMEVEEITQLITKLLIILVPVGLTIFGTLLLVYLLSSKRWLHL